MKVEEIAEAVAKLPPDQLARFRRWFTAFEAAAPITLRSSTLLRLNSVADRVLMDRSKVQLYSITSSARASSVGGSLSARAHSAWGEACQPDGARLASISKQLRR
jgi:hypothetical protein